jgi:hypothetical protein
MIINYKKITMIKQNIEWYKENRLEHYNYVKYKILDNKNEIKFKVVSAPVKVGKRSFVIITKLLEPEETHIFLSALHRKSDKNQRDEYKLYGIEVFTSPNDLKKKCFAFIDDILSNSKKIITIHLDELDFGCGEIQNISKIVKNYDNISRIKFILYSATSEVAETEFLSPNKIDNYVTLDKFNPSSTYYGIKNFIDDNLMHEAKDFFDYNFDYKTLDISEQGKTLIKQLSIDTNKYIGIIRLSGNIKDKDGNSESRFDIFKEHSQKIITDYNIRIRFIGSNDDVCKWDNQTYWEEISNKYKYIFVINQVAGRSTEWKCHPFLAWYHCLRQNTTTPTSTIIQDQERPVYYSTEYNKNNNIHIYGDILTAKYSAGIITYAVYNEKSSRKLNPRLNNKSKGYKITMKDPKYYNSWDEIPPCYTKHRNLSSHVKEEYKLKKNNKMSDKFWDKHKQNEDFYMSNIRGSRKKVLAGKKGTPIYFKKDIENDLKEGISEKYSVRLNLYYENNETNYKNFKFVVRELDKLEEHDVDNKSVYNI